MKSDLRNLAAAEEAYFADYLNYTSSTAAPLDYNASQGVTVAIGAATGQGWAATAAHTGTSTTCALYYGNASAPAPATQEGVVACN